MSSHRTQKAHHVSYPNVFDAYFAEVNRNVFDLSSNNNAYFVWQSAMLDLTNRRAKAYMDLCAAMARCETSQELVEEQSRFCASVIDDYADCSRGVMSAWQDVLDVEPLIEDRLTAKGHTGSGNGATRDPAHASGTSKSRDGRRRSIRDEGQDVAEYGWLDRDGQWHAH